jgi:hypothetical protein
MSPAVKGPRLPWALARTGVGLSRVKSAGKRSRGWRGFEFCAWKAQEKPPAVEDRGGDNNAILFAACVEAVGVARGG